MSASDKKKLRKEQNAAQLTEKQQKEKAESRKLKGYTYGFLAIIALVLVIALVTVGVTAYMNSGIPQRNTIALTVGEHSLTTADLNYFYTNAISQEYIELYSQYGNQTSMYAMFLLGLDVTTPLDEQKYDENSTFADHYTDLAVEEAIAAYTFYDRAIAEGHTLTETEQSLLDSNISMVEIYAGIYGYGSATEYLQSMYGKAADVESFTQYQNVVALAQSYQQKHMNSLSYDKDAISTYNDAHYNEFSTFSYNIFLMKKDNFIACSASEDDKDHVHTAEELENALKTAYAAAQAVVDSKASTVPALDKEISKIPGCETKKSTSFNDQSYETVPAVFASWVADSSRKVGDLDIIVKENTVISEDGTQTTTTDGYYVIMFNGREDNNMNLVNIRHILAQFQGGTADPATGTKVYSDAEKEAARKEIEEIKKTWEDGDATAESFAALATEKTDDTASAGAGGLYENVYPGQMVEAFNNWCFDETRQSGDCEIVETKLGYHLIYFVDRADLTFREYMVTNAMTAEDYETWYNDICDNADHNILDVSKLDRDMIIEGII